LDGSKRQEDAVTFLPSDDNLCNVLKAIDVFLTLSLSSSSTMSLRDLACYTLTLKPHQKDPKVTELVSVENGREEHRFARVREERDGEVYSSSIYGMSPPLFQISLYLFIYFNENVQNG
jgi:hypothetical protein